MEKIDISSDNISLSELVKHVSRDGVVIEFSDSETPLARLVPINGRVSMEDLDHALRESSELSGDGDSFADDVLSVRRDAGELDRPSES